MNIKNELQKAINTGLPLSIIAKKIGKDPSTLNKWLHGTRNVSPEIEELVYQVLLSIKDEWKNICILDGKEEI